MIRRRSSGILTTLVMDQATQCPCYALGAAGWAVEIRDDGKGFDADDPPAEGRRHFGLQFMRERAELIGARFEVRSSPDLGTAVRMTIPPGAMGMPIPGEEQG